jgi:hypothetical protein
VDGAHYVAIAYDNSPVDILIAEGEGVKISMNWNMMLPTATSVSKVLRGFPRSWRGTPPIEAYEMPPVWKS